MGVGHDVDQMNYNERDYRQHKMARFAELDMNGSMANGAHRTIDAS